MTRTFFLSPAGICCLQPHGQDHTGHLVPIRPQSNHSEVHRAQTALVSLHHNCESILLVTYLKENPGSLVKVILFFILRTFMFSCEFQASNTAALIYIFLSHRRKVTVGKSIMTADCPRGLLPDSAVTLSSLRSVLMSFILSFWF